MDNQIETLDKISHSKLRKKHSFDYQHIKDDQMSPINMNEFADAGTCFPLLFVKHRKTAKLFPIALFGLEKGENLFYSKEGWKCTYAPTAMRCDPFSLEPVASSNDPGHWKVCVNVNSHNVSEKEGEPLFDDGSPSPLLEAISKELIKDVNEQAMTAQFVNYLVENNLITAIKFNLTYANNEVRQIDGIYTIDELALETLSPEQVQEIYQKGYFKPIYCMLGSRHNLYELIRQKRGSSKESLTRLTIIDNQNPLRA
jgi:hypothetical protein